jgi:hypothetical protein
MSEETDWDWSPLGEIFWTEAGATTGATSLQVRFACCRHRGMTAAGAARAAGYSGDDDSIRQAGSRAAKSTAVMNLLALGAAEAGGGDDGVVGTGEARRILSRLARGSDPNVRIKALESLQKIEERQRAERSRDDGATDAAGIVRQILADMGSEGVLSASEMWFYASGGNLLTCPGFELIAPVICRRFPDCWQRYRAPLLTRFEYFKNDYEKAFLDRFDAAGAAPEPTEPEFRALVMDKAAVHRGNGAAAPEQVEQVEDHAAA